MDSLFKDGMGLVTTHRRIYCRMMQMVFMRMRSWEWTLMVVGMTLMVVGMTLMVWE